MKTLLTLLTVLAAGSLAAQPPKTPDHSVKTTLPPPETIIVSKPPQATVNSMPGSIAGHKVVYSGIAVQVMKTKEPAELINPFAPAEYGSGHQNLDRNIITGKDTGAFKIFSISF